MRSIKVEIIKEILRLKEQGHSISDIHRATKADRKTISKHLAKIKKLELKYNEVKEFESSKIQDLLFPEKPKNSQRKIQPSWQYIYEESQRKNLTLKQLWYEFIENNPDGISYSRFVEYFKKYRKTIDFSMRQVHKMGEKCFIDFAGLTIPIFNQSTGEVFNAQIFVSALGGSSYTFAYAVRDQSIYSWLKAHCKMFEFYGGVAEILVIDNLKAGVTKTCRYDPIINKSYQDLLEHYATTVMPARVRKPQDKSKAEIAVQIIQRAMSVFRDHNFFSIHELNQALEMIVDEINTKAFQKLEGSRKLIFAEEKKYLKALPIDAYEPTEWKQATVHKDYHVQYDAHYYSVPYENIGSKVEVCSNSNLVKIFKDGKSIAVHKRSYEKGRYTTVKEHRPKKHQKYLEWTPERIKRWASKEVGPITGELVKRLLDSVPNSEINYRKGLGIIRLGKNYEKERIENASKRLLEAGIGTNPYQSLKKILIRNLDQENLVEELKTSISHENIRGKEYFV